MAHELDTLNETVSRMSNAELCCTLERLVKADRVLSARLLVRLGEVEERGLYREHGYSSMFSYCQTALGMSEAEAYLRILIARLGRQFPLVLERLSEGSLHLSAIKMLAPHLTLENHVRLLDGARGKTKRQVEVQVAELAPKPDVPASMRKLPAAPTVTLQLPRARASSTPLSPGRFKVVITVGQEVHDKLERLQEMLRHQNPDGDLSAIITRAVTELLERETKRRYGASASTRQAAPEHAKPEVAEVKTSKASAVKSRYIPRKVSHEVFARDNGQCTFVNSDGRRCASRAYIEVHHHDVTFARGGEATVENLRLTCRAHNLLLAEHDYGRTFMQRKLREAVVRRNGAPILERDQV